KSATSIDPQPGDRHLVKETTMKAEDKPDRATAGVAAITRALAQPFELTEVKFKPAVVTGNRALALAYVDARVIQDRLDDVLGVTGLAGGDESLAGGFGV